MPSKKQNAGITAGALDDLAGGPDRIFQTTKTEIDSNSISEILASKSTSLEVQLQKTLALLRQGPMTTMDLRSHGVMMPAARVFQLKNERNHAIITELVTLQDENGFRHGRCARYHLMSGSGAA